MAGVAPSGVGGGRTHLRARVAHPEVVDVAGDDKGGVVWQVRDGRVARVPQRLRNQARAEAEATHGGPRGGGGGGSAIG